MQPTSHRGGEGRMRDISEVGEVREEMATKVKELECVQFEVDSAREELEVERSKHSTRLLLGHWRTAAAAVTREPVRSGAVPPVHILGMVLTFSIIERQVVAMSAAIEQWRAGIDMLKVEGIVQQLREAEQQAKLILDRAIGYKIISQPEVQAASQERRMVCAALHSAEHKLALLKSRVSWATSSWRPSSFRVLSTLSSSCGICSQSSGSPSLSLSPTAYAAVATPNALFGSHLQPKSPNRNDAISPSPSSLLC